MSRIPNTPLFIFLTKFKEKKKCLNEFERNSCKIMNDPDVPLKSKLQADLKHCCSEIKFKFESQKIIICKKKWCAFIYNSPTRPFFLALRKWIKICLLGHFFSFHFNFQMQILRRNFGVSLIFEIQILQYCSLNWQKSVSDCEPLPMGIYYFLHVVIWSRHSICIIPKQPKTEIAVHSL